jgi:Icc-related predicted phosphoesterase
VRVAATADLHCRVDTTSLVDDLLGDIAGQVDVLVLAGDLTDTGLPEEARCLARQLRRISIPIVCVLGNHDHESGKPGEVANILSTGRVCVLDGSALVIGDTGFAGTKGFTGGFGANLVQSFGEADLKRFIQAGVEEAARLQQSLARLNTRHKLAVLHYAPIVGTLKGEREQLYPFLGCSRFGDAVDCAGADLVVHGHAHHGAPFGVTAGNIPVYNVSRYVLSGVTNQSYRIIQTDGEVGLAGDTMDQDVSPLLGRDGSKA